MKDNLTDLVKHTVDLGTVSVIKVEGTTKKTSIEGVADDRSVIIQGTFLDPIDEFKGTFGMPNLNILRTLLSIEEYQEDAKITVKQDKAKGPVSMNFKNAAGDFTNDYRFMVKDVVDDQLKSVKFKGANWDVEIEPTVASINRLKMQATANAEEATFTMKTDGTDLVIYFGDHSSHAGNFVFATDVSGELKKGWHWPVGHIIGILSLDGDKTFKVSDDGATEIIVNSGLAEYTYILPAQTK